MGFNEVQQEVIDKSKKIPNSELPQSSLNKKQYNKT